MLKNMMMMIKRIMVMVIMMMMIFENIIVTTMMMTMVKIDEEGLLGKKKVNTNGKSVFERALSLPATNWHCCISGWVGSI